MRGRGDYAWHPAASTPASRRLIPTSFRCCRQPTSQRRSISTRSQLRRAIERVAIAAARDDSRPILAAVLFEVGEPGLTIAAADGFRLARVVIQGVAGDHRHLLVPVRAVSELGRLLADTETARLMTTPDGGGLHLMAGDTTLFTRLVDGRFPDIERVIPPRGGLASLCRRRASARPSAWPASSARMARSARSSSRLGRGGLRL